MKYERTHKQIEQMKHQLLIMGLFLEGHPIEWCIKREGIWRTTTDSKWEPAWDWERCDYRVHKPQKEYEIH